MGLERDVDLDVGVLTSSRKVLWRDPNAVRSMRAPRENASEWMKCLPIVPIERQSRQAISEEDR